MQLARVQVLLTAVLTLGPAVFASFAQQTPPDLILFNGKIYTSNPHQPYAQALAISGERIVAVGSSKEIASLAGSNTKQIDVGGRTVIPGFNDAHEHIGLSPERYSLPLNGMDPQWKDVTAAISAAIAKVPKGTWIKGSIGVSVLEDPQATRTALDKLAPDNPVILLVWTGHSSVMNTLALRKLGISEDELNPEGGQYVRGKTDGRLTGQVLEFAQFQVAKRFSELTSNEDAQHQLAEYFDQSARWGVTTVQNMSVPVTQARLAALLAKEPPPIRVRLIWFGYTNHHGRLTTEGHAPPVPQVPLLTLSGAKWILDGTPVEYSCAMKKPYADRPATTGTPDFTEKEMEDILRESLKNNDQLMVHICGDRTTEDFLNAMDATGGKKIWSGRRVRIEHGDGLTPDLIARAHELNVVVVQNPTHLALPELMLKRDGPDQMNRLQPLRSLLDAGIPLAIGSDGPDNPYLNIMLASIEPARPKEAITREQAVTAYTLTSAFAEFAEKDKGSIEPGKLADLAVLSQDIFTIPASALPATESVLTLVGGKIIYHAPAIENSTLAIK
jgi:predicted amidohydrolase YtcJ